jgi:hypothetical protein
MPACAMRCCTCSVAERSAASVAGTLNSTSCAVGSSMTTRWTSKSVTGGVVTTNAELACRAICHRHIERFTRYARRHGDVAGIDGGALGAVDGDGVPQSYVFGNVVRI